MKADEPDDVGADDALIEALRADDVIGASRVVGDADAELAMLLWALRDSPDRDATSNPH